MKLLKPSAEILYLLPPYQVGKMFDGFPFGSRFPQMMNLIIAFHKAGGRYGVGLSEKNIVADYISGKEPLVRYYSQPTASITIHELAHHRQATRLPEFWRHGGMHPVVGMWIEADARVHEALHALEVIEYLKATDQSTSMMFWDMNYFEDLSRLESMCAGTMDDLEDIACSRNPIPKRERLEFLRDVFDSFVDGFTKDQVKNMGYISSFSESMAAYNSNVDTSSRRYLRSSVSWLALTAAMVPMPSAAIPAFFAGMEIYRQKQFIECADAFYNPPSAEYAEDKLSVLGHLPCGYGNYLTDVDGESLGSAFYRSVCPEMDKIINLHREDLKSLKLTQIAKRFCTGLLPSMPSP